MRAFRNSFLIILQSFSNQTQLFFFGLQFPFRPLAVPCKVCCFNCHGVTDVAFSGQLVSRLCIFSFCSISSSWSSIFSSKIIAWWITNFFCTGVRFAVTERFFGRNKLAAQFNGATWLCTFCKTSTHCHRVPLMTLGALQTEAHESSPMITVHQSFRIALKSLAKLTCLLRLTRGNHHC